MSLAKECELIDAALAYGAAQAKYSAEYDRRPPESIKRDGWTDVQFDEAQSEAVTALNRARVRMERLAEELYALSKEPGHAAIVAALDESEAIGAHAKALADEADRRGTTLVIHRCPKGEWLVGFGENMQEVLAQESDFGNALFAATLLRAFALQTKEERSPQAGEER